MNLALKSGMTLGTTVLAAALVISVPSTKTTPSEKEVSQEARNVKRSTYPSFWFQRFVEEVHAARGVHAPGARGDTLLYECLIAEKKRPVRTCADRLDVTEERIRNIRRRAAGFTIVGEPSTGFRLSNSTKRAELIRRRFPNHFYVQLIDAFIRLRDLQQSTPTSAEATGSANLAARTDALELDAARMLYLSLLERLHQQTPSETFRAFARDEMRNLTSEETTKTSSIAAILTGVP